MSSTMYVHQSYPLPLRPCALPPTDNNGSVPPLFCSFPAPPPDVVERFPPVVQKFMAEVLAKCDTPALEGVLPAVVALILGRIRYIFDFKGPSATSAIEMVTALRGMRDGGPAQLNTKDERLLKIACIDLHYLLTLCCDALLYFSPCSDNRLIRIMRVLGVLFLAPVQSVPSATAIWVPSTSWFCDMICPKPAEVGTLRVMALLQFSNKIEVCHPLWSCIGALGQGRILTRVWLRRFYDTVVHHGQSDGQVHTSTQFYDALQFVSTYLQCYEPLQAHLHYGGVSASLYEACLMVIRDVYFTPVRRQYGTGTVQVTDMTRFICDGPAGSTEQLRQAGATARSIFRHAGMAAQQETASLQACAVGMRAFREYVAHRQVAATTTASAESAHGSSSSREHAKSAKRSRPASNVTGVVMDRNWDPRALECILIGSMNPMEHQVMDGRCPPSKRAAALLRVTLGLEAGTADPSPDGTHATTDVVPAATAAAPVGDATTPQRPVLASLSDSAAGSQGWSEQRNNCRPAARRSEQCNECTPQGRRRLDWGDEEEKQSSEETCSFI